MSSTNAKRADPVLVDLADLDATTRAPLLDRFEREIYLPAFPIADEREDVDVWRRILAERPPPPAPELHVLLAVDGARPLGGFVFERYRRSGFALGTYVAVAREMRGRGLAGRLVEAAYDILKAGTPPGAPPPVFLAEAENPAKLDRDADRTNALNRLKILTRLGYLVSDLPYVQPALDHNKAPTDILFLIAYGASLPPGLCVAGEALSDYLDEFFASLDAVDARNTRHLNAMKAWLKREGRLSFRTWQAS